MNKKAFTLVEMLAVVVILGLVLLIAIPLIQNQVSNKKGSIHETTLEMIYSATESLIASDPANYPVIYNGEEDKIVYCITLQQLVDSGKLEAPIKNFSTGDEINLAYNVKAIPNEFNEFNYELLESTTCDDSSATELVLYKDPTLKVGTGETGPFPELYAGMIPVVYKNGNWVKASLYDAWYSYSNTSTGYKWANVVTVNTKASTCEKADCKDSVQNHNRSYYEKAVPGTKISLDDINGMFVWIPKFEYKISGNYGDGGSNATSASSPGAITVNFLPKTTITATSGFTVHPAFKISGKNLSGIWVSKFEASAALGSKCALNGDAKSCNNKSTTVNYVPNANSWRYITLGNAFEVTRSMTDYGNVFGLKSNQVNTHIMKNSDWGAVAYLTQSKYGRYGKDKKEVFVNRYYNNGTLTGCTAGASGTGISLFTTCVDSEGEKLNYNYEATYGGSTSGTIYGIFDMSGGAWEFTMGNYGKNTGSSEIPLVDYIDEEDETKNIKAIDTNYYDLLNTKTCSSGECVGQGLLKTELGLSGSNWWLDNYDFALTDLDPWLIRGGSWEIDSQYSGIFAVKQASGAAQANTSFRPTIISIVSE